MTTTTNLGLQKPEESDTLGASLTAFNANFDALDTAVESKADKVKSKSAMLRASGWDETAKTVTARVAGVTAASHIIVQPTAASFEAWWAAGVRCTTQSTDTLTFQCTTVPTENLTASVLILG